MSDTGDLFADSVEGVFAFNGCMRMTLVTSRANHRADPAVIEKAVVGRLVMPMAEAEKLARLILTQVERSKPQLVESGEFTQ